MTPTQFVAEIAFASFDDICTTGILNAF